MAPPDDDPRSDADLVEAANAGDPAAFEAIYERYRDWVVSLAWRFTRDRDLALDAMQDTFTYLLGKFPGFELRARMTTFLYPVVRHNAQALARRRRRTTGGEAPSRAAEVAGEAPPADRADPVGDVLARAVEALPDAHREVLLLRFVDGLSMAEIAAAVGIPIGTVKSRLHHALRALRADERLAKLMEP